MLKEIVRAIDDLSDELLEEAMTNFLEERNLVGEFIVWLEKWKSVHLQGR